MRKVISNILKPRHKISKAPTHISREPKYVEVEWRGGKSERRNYIKVVSLNEFADVEGILDTLRDRNTVVILKVKPRLVQEKLELKRALKRIQRTVDAIGGDIAGVKEDIIVMAPPDMEIWRPEGSFMTTPIDTSMPEAAPAVA